MKTHRYFLAAACLAMAASSWASPVGIASGQPTGTNHPMAADIAKVCSTPASPINNVLSDGSLDNIAKTYNDKGVQYGIVQADAAEYMKGTDPKMMQNILMVFPFFSTEMHLIVKDGSPITNLSQLAGKRVVEGPQGSGTWVSVQVIKALTGIKWETVTEADMQSQTGGFKAVIAGKADAEFIVAGAPVKILVESTGFKLVPLSHPALDKFGLYTKTLMGSGMYPAVKGTTQTYKVDNMLITYNFRQQYQKEIGELVTCITKNIPMLQRDAGFHPKWRDVDPLDIDRIKWPTHPAAVAAIKKATAAQK